MIEILKNIIKHFAFLTLVILIVNTVSIANINNYGAYIKVKNNMHVRIVGLDLNNRTEGQFRIQGDSEMRIDSAIVNIDGSIELLDQSRIFISDSSFHNTDTLSIELDALLRIRDNMINSGMIYNAGVIDIGE